MRVARLQWDPFDTPLLAVPAATEVPRYLFCRNGVPLAESGNVRVDCPGGRRVMRLLAIHGFTIGAGGVVRMGGRELTEDLLNTIARDSGCDPLDIMALVTAQKQLGLRPEVAELEDLGEL